LTPSERAAGYFDDIVRAADLITGWAAEAGGGGPTILDDPKSRSAIERQFLVISEAAARLHKLDPAIGPRLAPNIDWQGIRGIGNFIRHRYDDLDRTVLVDVIEHRLAELRLSCLAAVATLGGERRE
jgi:uncharacterized protein with HEPN domain